MIQLNLLPDVKLQYIKAERSRRLVLGVSAIVAIASVALLLLLLSVDGLQKKHLSDLTKDINVESSKLQNEPQIDKMLTVQNQLQSLTALHSAKPAASRLFTYLNELTPTKVSITDLNIDFTQDQVTITGTSDSLANVNKYIDTLKYTTFTTDSNKNSQPVFSNVVLSSFSLNSTSQDVSQAANYTVTMSFDKTVFDATQNVKLSVPSKTATRSQTSQPNDLFKDAPSSKGGQ